MKLPNGMIVNDNLGRPRYIDRHNEKANRRGTRRQRREYWRAIRLARKMGIIK